MVPTQHQLLDCWVNDHRSVSDEWMREQYVAGARVASLQLQDHAPIPPEKIERWKNIMAPNVGFKVRGNVRPSGPPLHPHGVRWDPVETAEWIFQQKRDLKLQGIGCNNEMEVWRADLDGLNWSRKHVRRFRELMPAIGAQLNTFPLEGLDHLAYRDAGFRVNMQTASDVQPLNWTPAWLMAWCKAVGWPKAKIKVTVPVMPIAGNELVPVLELVRQWKLGGQLGGTLYYIDGAMPPGGYLVPLIRALRDAGCVL